MIGLGYAARAVNVLTVAALLLLPQSLAVTAETAAPGTILDTSAACEGACVPTERMPPEGTVMACIVFVAVVKTAFLVRCVDLFLGTVSADPSVNGYSGFLLCQNRMNVGCSGVVKAFVRDYPEPISTKEKLHCTIVGSHFTNDLELECAKPS